MAQFAQDPKIVEISIDEDGEEIFEEETILERIEGLKEMFPDTVRNVVSSTTSSIASLVRTTVKYSGKTLWVVSTSALLLVLPVLYEHELDAALEMQERQQMSQQQQLLYGPGLGGVPPVPK